MDLGLTDKVALVMASSAGIGKAVALEFARQGARVMLFARSEEKLRQAQREIAQATGNEPAYTVGDVCRAEDIDRVVERTLDQLGPVYALVNNSGGPPAGPFEQFDDAAWMQAFELTLLSFVRSTRAVLPAMKAAGGGRIANITSSSVRRVLDNLILSNTFRMGVLGLTKSLARELGPDNILVNVLGPGKIETERVAQLDRMRAERAGISPEELKAKVVADIPLGRYGSPGEFAQIAVFLCSQANTYITGQTVLVDGGLVRAY